MTRNVFSSLMCSTARLLLAFWPSLLVLIVILYGTLTPDPLDGEPLPAIPGIDKIIHFIMMGGLTAAILFDIRRQRVKTDSQKSAGITPATELKAPYRHISLSIILYVAVGVAIFSLFDEWLQGRLSIGRPSDPFDAIANILGILVASVLAPPILKKIFTNI